MPTNLGHRVLPCLLVADMRRSLDFYLHVLGFTDSDGTSQSNWTLELSP